MREESSSSSPKEAGDSLTSSGSIAGTEPRASDPRTRPAIQDEVPDSQPGLFPDSERRALEPPASPASHGRNFKLLGEEAAKEEEHGSVIIGSVAASADGASSNCVGLLEQSPVMSSEDKRVLEAIRSAVNAAGKNYGCIRDAADPTVVSLVLKKMPHIDSCWLSGRIREFQAIVNDHVQKKVPITENKEILLEVFASASSKKRAFDGEAGNCHAKRSSGSDSADNRSAGWMEKKANAEVWLQEAEAAKTIVSSPLNIGDVNRKLQDLGFRGKDLINALEVFMDPSNLQNLEIRQVFLTMKEEDDARNYVLHKLGEN